MKDEPLNLSDIPSGTRVMALIGGKMHPAVVTAPIPGEPTSPGYISVELDPPIPDEHPERFITRLATNLTTSIEVGWVTIRR